MPSIRDMLDQYRNDRDSDTFAEIIETCRPLVTAICQRHIVDGGDLEDAVQETFVKLARHADVIHGDVEAWLRSAAATTAVDFTRRALLQRTHLKSLTHVKTSQCRDSLSWEDVQVRIEEALAGLDAEDRAFVIARFFDGISVGQIARERGVSPATMTRRIGRATGRLLKALREMGFDSLEDASVAGGLIEPGPRQRTRVPNSVQPFPNGVFWQQPPHRPDPSTLPPKDDARKLGKWRRVIRVGVMVSEMSCTTPNYEGRLSPVEYQLWSTALIRGDNIRLFSLVEPGTHELASVERGARDYGLMAGMIDASDAQALRLLDVIYIGDNLAMPPRVLDAIAEAVSSGVGLYNKGWFAASAPGLNHPKVRRFYLADQVGRYHTPGCHATPVSATVLKNHQIIKTLRPGDKLGVSGCGPVFEPLGGHGTVLVAKDQPVVAMGRGAAALGPMKMPVIVAGRLGKGRVVIAALGPSQFMTRHGRLWSFTADAVSWLAEPSLIARERRWLPDGCIAF